MRLRIHQTVLLTAAVCLIAVSALVIGCGRKQQPEELTTTAAPPGSELPADEIAPADPEGNLGEPPGSGTSEPAKEHPTGPDEPEDAQPAPEEPKPPAAKQPPVADKPTPTPAAPKPRLSEESSVPETPAAIPRVPPEPEPEKPQGTTVVGSIKLLSNVPDPSTVTYKSCVTFIKYEVESVETGEYDGDELIAVFWGMRDSKLQPAARFSAGQRHRLTVQPLSERPELQRVMQADDTNDYSLTPYWVVSYSAR